MFNTEIAEAIKSVNLYEMAAKTEYKTGTFSEDETKLIV